MRPCARAKCGRRVCVCDLCHLLCRRYRGLCSDPDSRCDQDYDRDRGHGDCGHGDRGHDCDCDYGRDHRCDRDCGCDRGCDRRQHRHRCDQFVSYRNRPLCEREN
jgi:hypothetical protein